MPRRLFSLRPTVHFALLTCGLVACIGSASAAASASLKAQRDIFKKAYAAARQGDAAWHDMATRLKSYPLYAWLPAAAMEHDIDHLQTARVERYLKRHDGLLPAYDLRRHFLLALVRRKDWADFRKLYRPGLSTNLSCYNLQARLAQGETLRWKDMSSLWKHAWLPNSCTPVQKWAHAHGLLTRQRLWQRIDAAADAGRGSTVAWLARWLSGRDQTRAQHLAQALRHPTAAARAASGWADNSRNREAATLAMVKVARRNSARADQLWPGLNKHFTFSDAQTHRIRAAMALYVATDFSSDALQRLSSLPAAAQTNATRAWRVRVALARQDWPAAMKALDALSTKQKQQGQWRYWRARALDQLGRHKAARAAYAKQARQATFYGFLAADRAGLPYAICPHQPDDDTAREQTLLHQPGLQRAFELFAVGMLHDARRVWNRALDGESTDDRQLAALVAWKRGWYDRAIRTFSYGPLKQMYHQRFPLARQDGVEAQATDAGIDPAWAYAIIRAESAWMPDARSGADARGLMQLLPSTARLVSRRQNIAYDGNLYDPRTNIKLGTHYLAHMAARYGGAPWLATAAYNAGPGRVDDWLSERGQLPPDLFVATIPFHETRGYVMRVLAYSVIYDWLLHGDAVALAQRMPRYGKAYTPPDAGTPRKKVACPGQVGLDRRS